MGGPYGRLVRRIPGVLRSLLTQFVFLLLGAAILLGGGAGNRPPEVRLQTQPVLNVVDLLTAPVYTVRTSLARPDGTTFERTATGVILVPTVVDVDPPSGLLGLGTPDLTVTILPRLPLGVGVTINRAPLVGQAKAVKVEVELTLPTAGNKTIAFGYDARKDRNPVGFDADVQFGLQPGSTDLGLTTRINNPGTTLDLLGAIFNRPAGAPANTRIDTTEFSLGATPVPTQLNALATFTPGLVAFGDADDKNVHVTVHSNTPFHALAKAATVRGDDTMNLDVDVPQLPADLGLNYHNVKSTDVTDVTIDTGVGIPSATATFTKVTDAVTTQTINATATGIPSHAKLIIDGDTLAAGALGGYAEAAEREGVTWDANGPLTKLDLKYDRVDELAKPVHFETVIDALPPFIKATFDKVGTAKDLVVNANVGEGQPAITKLLAGVTIGDDKTIPYLTTDAPAYSSTDTTGSLRAAARIEGLTRARIDTRNPLVVEAHTNHAQRFVAKHVSKTLTLDADVQKLPQDVTFTLTTPPSAPPVVGPLALPRVTIVDVDGSAPIDHVDTTVHLTPVSGAVTHAVAHIDKLPEDFTATLTDGPGARHEMVWGASGPTERIDADVTTANAAGVPVHITALVNDLPPDLRVVFDKTGGDTFAEATAGVGQAIGLIEAGFATGTAPIPTRAEPAHAVINTTAAGTAAHVRVTGLRHVLLDTAEPFILDIGLVSALTFAVAQDTPKRVVDVTLAQVPTESHIEIANTVADDLKSTVITAKNNGAIAAINGTFTIRGVRPLTGTVDLDQLPAQFTLTLEDANDKEFNSILWDASAPTQHIGIVADTSTAKGEPLHLDAAIDGLPKKVLVTVEKLGAGSRIIAQALNPDEAVGAIRAGVGKNGARIPFLDAPDYVSASDDGIAARITEVKRIAADTADPFDVTVNLTNAVPFVVKQASTDLAIDATVRNLPSEAHVRLDLPNLEDKVKTTVIHYDGNDVIEAVDGTFGIATKDNGRFDGTFDLDKLPRVVDVTMIDNEADGTLVADYTGSSSIALAHVKGTLTPERGTSTTLDVTLPDAPSHAVLSVDEDALRDDATRTTMTWSASDVIGKVNATVETTTSDGLPLYLVTELTDLPEKLTVKFDKTDDGPIVDVVTDKGTFIGGIDAGLTIGDAVIPAIRADNGANIKKQGDNIGIKAVIHGVSHLLLDTRDPKIVDVDLDEAKPFILDAVIDNITAHAALVDLPASALVRLDTPDPAAALKRTFVHYDGRGSTIGRIDGTFHVVNDDGDTFAGSFDLQQLPPIVDVTLTDDGPADKLTVAYNGSGPIGPLHMNAALTPVNDARTIIDVKVPGAPARAVFTMDTNVVDGVESQTATWNADAPINRLDAIVETDTDDGLPLRLEAGIDALPKDVTVKFTKFDEGLVVDALAGIDAGHAVGQSIGGVDAGLLIGAGSMPTMAESDGAFVVIRGDNIGVKAKLHDVSHLGLDTREPFVVDVARGERALPVPFALDVQTDDLTISDGTITNLPRTVHVLLDTPEDGPVKTTVLDYSGSEPIGAVHLGLHMVTDDGGVIDGTVDLTQVPTAANVRIIDNRTGDIREVHYLGGPIQKVAADLVISQDGRDTRIVPVLEGVPSRVDVTIDSSQTKFTDTTAVDYDASGPVGKLDVVAQSAGGVAHAVLTGLPTHVEIDHVLRHKLIIVQLPGEEDEEDAGPPKDFTVDVTADGGVATTQVAFTKAGSTPITVDPRIRGAVHHVDGATFARLPGIMTAHLKSVGPLEARLTLDSALTTPVPLDVFVQTDGITIDGLIDSLPNNTDLTVDLDAGRIEYKAGAKISHIELEADAPPGKLLGETGTFSRITHVEATIDDLPTGVKVGFGKLDDGSEGVSVDAFAAPDPSTGLPGASPLLNLDLPSFDGPIIFRPSIGAIVLKAVEHAEDARTAVAAPTIRFDETERAQLVIALNDVQSAGLSQLEVPVTTTFATKATRTIASLRLNPFAPQPVNPLFVILDTQAKRLDGTPIDCQLHASVRVEGLPSSTKIDLINEERNSPTSSNGCDAVPEAVRAVSELTFPTRPNRLVLSTFRSAVPPGKQIPVITDRQLVDITQVPTNFFACTGQYTGLCTDLPQPAENERVSGVEVPFRDRFGSSLRLVSDIAMRIEQFQTCKTNGCAFGRPSTDPETTAEALEFKRFFGIVIPDGGPGRHGIDLDSVEPSLNNGPTINRLPEIGMLYFDSDNVDITIEAGEQQTIADDLGCSNAAEKKKLTRNGIGLLTTNADAAPFVFEAQGRLILITARSIDPGDACGGISVNCRYHEGTMAIKQGEIVSQAIGNFASSVSSLNQELDDSLLGC